jgi:tRNA modification GTPase
MTEDRETISAIATPPGTGGIGIVRISGPKALSIAHRITGLDPDPRRATYGTFHDHDNRIIDRGIVLYFKGPESYTGEDVVEFHGHGGQVVLNLLLRQTLAHGARPARPGEFTERAFLNGKLDLVQAEAVADLINSKSEYAARSAIRSLEGEFSRAVSLLQENIIAIRVYVESALDFPEEELDFPARPDIAERTAACINDIDGLLRNARSGRVLNEGIRAVIVGRPNVGKSSILNRLSGTERAIVTEIPGTTRDVIEDRIIIEGIFINVADTAGIHDTDNLVEKAGIRRSLAEIDKADVVLLVTESGVTSPHDLEDLSGMLPAHKQVILIENKIDLTNARPARVLENDRPMIALSAKTGAGMDLLMLTLREIAGLTDSMETPVLARTRHIEALEETRRCLDEGLKKHLEHNAAELFAAELTNAQAALGGITGAFGADQLLAEIFSKFCIGK